MIVNDCDISAHSISSGVSKGQSIMFGSVAHNTYNSQVLQMLTYLSNMLTDYLKY